MNDDWFTQYTETKAPDSLSHQQEEARIEMSEQGDGEGTVTLFSHMGYADNY